MRAFYDLPAPAKINLFLHVLGRRADGFHLLQSALSLVDWADRLHLERVSSGQISREDLAATPTNTADTGAGFGVSAGTGTGAGTNLHGSTLSAAPALVLPAQDLCVRAAQALAQASGCTYGVHIALQKNLPAQAGLGGGSSDAATCLLALNRLWQLHWPLERLCALGLQLGADVPFFLRGRAAWAEGVGERLRPLALPPVTLVLVKTPQGLSTPEVFAAPELQRNSQTAIIESFAARPWGFGRNDLQPVAGRLCAGVDLALQWLQAQGLTGRMSGSGSAVFAVLPAPQALGPVPMGWVLRRCSSLDVHPLWGWAASDD